MRPDPGTLRQDAVAGAPGAIASVPGGMASAVLVGVNLCTAYTPAWPFRSAALAVSTRLAVVTTTAAAALAAGSALGGCSGADRPDALFVLFGPNLALNLAWTLIVFRGRSPLAAGVEIVVLESTTVALVVRAWPLSSLAALLLVPYALWVAFATALTWAIWTRN